MVTRKGDRMDERDWLAQRFEENRSNLRKVAHRMLGSASEAEDVVQEAWLRLSQSDASAVENLGGWLTTVVARACLDALRSRRMRDAHPLTHESHEQDRVAGDPEHDVVVADSIGSALLVVLDALAPAERVAFVLHDMFDMPFEDIGPIVGRSPLAARQLASRARRRVQGTAVTPDSDRARDGEVVSAFLAASRDGNFEALLAVLHPDVVLHADVQAVEMGAANQWKLPSEVRGAQAVAETFKGRARGVRPTLIDGVAGAVWIHGGQPRAVWAFIIDEGRIAEVELVMDAARLAQLEIA
jgi:RNA polymerase sigma-70 factor (ECF subfamily)